MLKYIYILEDQFCVGKFQAKLGSYAIFYIKDIVFLSDNRCAFTTIHSLDKMTSTWIHIVSWIPFYWCVSSGIVCCREEKLQSSGQKSIRYLTSEIGKSATFAIFLLDSVFLNSTMEFLVLVSVKRGDTKTIVGKQQFSLKPDIFHDIGEKFQTKFFYKKLISNFARFYSEFYLPQIH